MIKSISLVSRLGAASLALLVAIAVYCFVRLNPPELLVPFQISSSLLGTQSGLFGSAPSFFYTLALGLVLGTCAATRASRLLHCLLWVLLALCLEVSQAPVVSVPLAGRLEGMLPNPVFELIESYWNNGVFDSLDLIATVAAGALAAVLLAFLPAEKSNQAKQ